MKNESQIVELLAELLKKQDRYEEILTRLVDVTGAHGKTLDSHSQIFGKQEILLTKIVEGQDRLIYEFHKMNDHLLTRQEKIEDRVSRLEDKVFKS